MGDKFKGALKFILVSTVFYCIVILLGFSLEIIEINRIFNVLIMGFFTSVILPAINEFFGFKNYLMNLSIKTLFTIVILLIFGLIFLISILFNKKSKTDLVRIYGQKFL